jgi:hypothetical protein
MNRTAPITIGAPRRIGIVAAARALGVSYGHLYRCLLHLNGDRERGRPPGRALAAAIRQRYPELITQEAAPCSR